MFRDIKFAQSASSMDTLPKRRLPEIILCGRSNVGKSSFINSFFNRKGLAKTSSSPGKTKTLNYYLVDDKFYIVDLPGFGYAKVSQQERDQWKKIVEDFITQSEHILAAFHFIDSRYEPTKLDEMLNQFLKQLNIPYQIILTKIDKCKQSEISASKKNIKKVFGNDESAENFILYSSVKPVGRKEVLNIMSNLLK